MKAHQIIDVTLADWHVVDAALQASETFDQLDSDEVYRLARRAFAEEWRAALRIKDADGVPLYASIETNDSSGNACRMYKQTELFSVADYNLAIEYHHREIRSHASAAKSLAKRCNEVHGTQLPLVALSELSA